MGQGRHGEVNAAPHIHVVFCWCGTSTRPPCPREDLPRTRISMVSQSLGIGHVAPGFSSRGYPEDPGWPFALPRYGRVRSRSCARSCLNLTLDINLFGPKNVFCNVTNHEFFAFAPQG